MATLQLHNQMTMDIVMVPGSFIDIHMPAANGEYVKIYLYLLRALNHPNIPVTVSHMADLFDLTEKDVIRALSHWEHRGLLRLSFTSDRTLTDITMIDDANAVPERAVVPEKQLPKQADSPTASVPPMTAASQAPPAAKSTPQPSSAASSQPISRSDLTSLSEDTAFSELLFLAQAYLKKTFRPTDCDILGYWYLQFNRSYEIIEYLLEYCVEQGHSSMKYLEAVALNWHSMKFTSVEEIKDYASARTKVTYAVMKSFGLSDRVPGTKEAEFIQKWLHTYGFSQEMIILACDKTITATHNPSFEYADRILSSWKKAGITTPDQVESHDKEHQIKVNRKKAATASQPQSKPSNAFHNFEQRSTDYDRLVADYYGYRKQQ